MITSIKKGDSFICIKDMLLFKAGRVYTVTGTTNKLVSFGKISCCKDTLKMHFIRNNWNSLYNHLMSLVPADFSAWEPFKEVWDRFRLLTGATDPDIQHELTVEEIKAKEADQEVRTDMVNDPVNNPSHYTTGRIEVIDFIEDQRFNYNLGNAVKYISRAGKKDPDKTVQDLQKAVWYVQREIARLEGGKSCE